MIRRTFAAALTIPALLASVALADEAAEAYVDEALPFMYHSCESVVVEAEGDEAYIETVLRAHVAVALYNRDIDVTAIELTDARKDELQAAFIEALRAGCESDRRALLAGVVDAAVAGAVSEVAPGAYVR